MRRYWLILTDPARKLRSLALNKGGVFALRAVLRKLFAVPAASVYRALLLRRVTFIAVTGSTAKTTTKELIAAVLMCRFKGTKTEFSSNLPLTIAGTILSARPTDRFCVVEVAAAIGGQKVPMDDVLSLVKPTIGVVTNIGTDHQSAFGSIDNIAEAKSKLVEAIPTSGVAILNADDERVAAMAAKCDGRVAFYGSGAASRLRASNIRSDWPDRLSFDVSHRGETCAIRTQFCGEFWVHPILAAMSVGLELNLPLSEMAETIGRIPPYARRMEPVMRDDGMIFIRDDQKTPITSIPLVLRFLERAHASRKIVVYGTISDYKGNSDRMYVSVAKQTLDVADHVIFIGPRSKKALKARKDHSPEVVHAFLDTDAAGNFLATFLRKGDLVLLKGTNRDELASLIDASPRAASDGAAEGSAPSQPRRERVRCIVGLGNFGERYHDTPHNIGHTVVNLLAHSLHAQWADAGDATIAEINGRDPIYLVKLKTNVNNSGRVLLRVAERLGASAPECLIVHDDADLPFGAVRMRANGSDGGHRGVRSILKEFGTDEIQRVKLGIKSSSQAGTLAEQVVASVAPADRKKADDSCAAAVGMLTAIVRKYGIDVVAGGADGRT